MPIYEYLCGDCDRRFEAMQKMADAPLTECRLCGKSGQVSKCVTAAGFQLKGGGWYVTDFRDGKKSGGETKTDEKSEAKPDAKVSEASPSAPESNASSAAPAAAPAPAPASSPAPAASSAG